MNLLTSLTDENIWATFLDYKISSGFRIKREEKQLRSFIQSKGYLNVNLQPGGFSIPEKHIVKREGSRKKRVVYSFHRQENYVLKLLTYLLIRKYDNIYAPNLYSYRSSHDVSSAVRYFKRDHKLKDRYVYKLDIHDYFNSIDIHKLLSALRKVMSDEPDTFEFIAAILYNPYVKEADGTIVVERKGVMAGVPIAAFLSNLYLNHIDHYFYKNRYRYARYADDILLMADTEAEVHALADKLKSMLGECSLEINPDKERLYLPGEAWTYLGIKYVGGRFDVSDESLKKLYIRIHSSYHRQDRNKNHNGLAAEKAAKRFIRSMNCKLFQPVGNSELTWTRWYFRAITTNVTLRRIDRYMQECIRFLATGTRTKRRFNCRYSYMKTLGYLNLVNEYHKYKDLSNSKQMKN